MRGRTNTMTTNVSKVSVSTSKRPGGRARPNSNITQISGSEDTSIIVPVHPHVSNVRRPVELIAEVDGRNSRNNIVHRF